MCRDGMGPRNKTNLITMQSRPARQSQYNDFGVIVRMNRCPYLFCYSNSVYPENCDSDGNGVDVPRTYTEMNRMSLYIPVYSSVVHLVRGLYMGEK